MNEVVDKLPGQKCPLLFALRTQAGTQGHLYTVGYGTQKQLESLDLPFLASTAAYNRQSFRGGKSLSCFPKHLGAHD